MKLAIEEFRKSKTYNFKYFNHKIGSTPLQPGTKYHIKLIYDDKRMIECDVTYKPNETEEVILPAKERKVFTKHHGKWVHWPSSTLEDAVNKYNTQVFYVTLNENGKETNVRCRIYFVDIPGKDYLLLDNSVPFKYAYVANSEPSHVYDPRYNDPRYKDDPEYKDTES